MEPKSHWESVYRTKAPGAVSWYAPHLRESLAYIQRTGLPAAASVMDVGGGEATLVDDLLEAGYGNEPEQRAAYVAQVLRVLRPGGFAIVGTFGPQGPEQCSGLPVARYAPDELHGESGGRFVLVDNSVDVHTTPWGTAQQFVYCFCRLEH